MRQKSTVYDLSQHIPFQESKDELRVMKEGKGRDLQKDLREGQSAYRKKLATKKK